MSILYFLAFSGVCAVVLGVMIQAIRDVSRRPVWSDPTLAYTPAEPRKVRPIQVGPVDPRHSGFVGLSNEPEFQLTA